MTTSKMSVAIAMATGFFCSTAAFSQQVDTRPNIYAGGMLYSFEHSRDQHDDTGYFLGFEAPLTQRWSANLELFELESDHEDLNTKSDARYYRLGGNYHLDMLGRWQPYFSAGIGYLDIDPNDTTGSVLSIGDSTVDLGFGLKRFLSDNIILRGDIKTVAGLDEDAYMDYIFGLSVGYVFGGGRTRTAATSAPSPAAPASAPMDSDGDGVPDNRDSCQNTPAGATVDARGCEVDSDRDGVVDSRDDCPNTSIELAVDANGCPILEVSQMRQELLVNFEFDQSEVRPEYDDEIDEFADFMTQYGNTTVVIEGHTDNVGDETYNQGLSERRANAVRNVLIQRYDIPAGRLSTVGYGEGRPVASNDTAAGRQRNRRIEAEVSVEVEEARRR